MNNIKTKEQQAFEMIEQGMEQNRRLERLNEIAKKQYLTLQDSSSIKRIQALENAEKDTYVALSQSEIEAAINSAWV